MFSAPKHTPHALEQMDHSQLQRQELILVERALDRINFCSGSFNRTACWLLARYRKHAAKQQGDFTFVDVGCGGGGLLRYLQQFALKHALKVDFLGIDTNEDLVAIARSKLTPATRIQYSSKRLETHDRSYSLIYSNLMLHHLRPSEIVPFLRLSKERASLACRHEDLLRSRGGELLALAFPRLVTRSSVVHHDAVVSVHRSYTSTEWKEAASQCGYSLRTVFPRRALLQVDLCS